MKQQRHGRLSTVATSVSLFIVALPILYVLSLGPAVWFVNSEHGSTYVAETIHWFYAPLEWVTGNIPVAGDLLNLYCRLWREW